MHSSLDRHWTYVADAQRIAGYDRAISQLVTPDSVVADLGSGLGLLGLIASRHHARRVYAIERTGLVRIAGLVAAANSGLGVVMVPGTSADIVLPESVDIIIADQMGPLGFEGGLRAALADAARRWLKPGGHVIPRTIRTYFAAAEVAVVRRRIDRWVTPQFGFDVSAVAALDESRVHWVARGEVALLSAAAPVWTIETVDDPARPLSGQARLKACRAGRFDGLVGWFEADLCDEVTITNRPDSPMAIDRHVAVLPLSVPVVLREGDEVAARIRAVSPREVMDWQVDIASDGQPTRHFAQNAIPYLVSEQPA